MRERLCVCLLCVLVIGPSGCNKASRIGAVPSGGSSSVMPDAGNSGSRSTPVTVAGAGTAGLAGVSVPAGGVGTAGRGAPSAPNAKFPLRNLIIGGCELTRVVPDTSMCTGWDELYECVARNCELAACEQACADYVACAGAAPDPCNVEGSCPMSVECDACAYSLKACGVEPCQLLLRCATPSPNGACSRLTACCQTQMDPAACMAYVDRSAQILGDPVCQMFIDDPGVRDTFFNNPPCQF
jgi:hypothetical protein